MKLIINLWITALFPALLFLIFPMVKKGELLNLNEMFSVFSSSYLITLFGLVFIGLPIIYFLKNFKMLSTFSLSIFGGIGGIIYLTLLNWFLSKASGNPLVLNLETITWGFILGSITAIIFGIVSGVNRNNA